MATKTIQAEIMSILRKYEIAGELSSKKTIHEVKEYRARMLSTLVGFTFERTRYYILTDMNANDNPEYVFEQIHLDQPNVEGRLAKNPKDEIKTFGMPFKGKDVYLVEVVSKKRRLDAELSDRYPELSRSTIQKYIKAGLVLVNGEAATQSKHAVTDVDEIGLTPPEAENHDAKDLPIVFIDDNVIVVNKPAGILTHSKGVMNQEFTVADFFRRYTSNALETNRPGIVHRLDRDTSGIIIGARNDETAIMLKKQFADRTTKKQYIAVVKGQPKNDKAVIDLPIGRNPKIPSMFRVDASGKVAQTTYEVLASTGDKSIVKLMPKTGRTHQLRVHLDHINNAIIGDRVYGRAKGDRLYLHALSLEITIPDGKREVFTAPLPASFTDPFEGLTINE